MLTVEELKQIQTNVFNAGNESIIEQWLAIVPDGADEGELKEITEDTTITALILLYFGKFIN